MTKIQILKQSRFGYWTLVFGIYLGFVNWDLEFWINHFTADKRPES
jgi:hypothetical protein